MANLAGFDVIAEAHIDTAIDFINQHPVTNPVDGKKIHILGGKFSTDLILPIGPVANRPRLRVFLEATLCPVVHESNVEVSIEISAGFTTIAGRSLNNIGGTATVVVPITFELPPGVPSTEPQTPVVSFSGTSPTVVLNQATRTEVDAISGQGAADRLTSGIREALTALLGLIGKISIQATGFFISPGVPSTRPNQLSALPTVAWINSTALGVFGYYRVPATGGDIHRKTDDDITTQTGDVFTSGPSGFPIPGRRVAILMSDVGFRLVIASM
ncbi:hypothetical protein ACEPPN_000968 [Leptodophora sp. 'Broadleaf-Isolate-01']